MPANMVFFLNTTTIIIVEDFCIFLCYISQRSKKVVLSMKVLLIGLANDKLNCDWYVDYIPSYCTCLNIKVLTFHMQQYDKFQITLMEVPWKYISISVFFLGGGYSFILMSNWSCISKKPSHQKKSLHNKILKTTFLGIFVRIHAFG